MSKKTSKKRTVKPAKTTFNASDFKSELWKSQTSFLDFVSLKEHPLKSADLSRANISWQELAAIYIDHQQNTPSLQDVANSVAEKFSNHEYVNSIRTRVKDPGSLIRKIIRKRHEGKAIGFLNYKSEISDLVGIRLLHVLKSEWIFINDEILRIFTLRSERKKPVAFISKNDETTWKPIYLQGGCVCVSGNENYKSVHYDIETGGFSRQKTILEIQVRTINEEAWSQLDHKINYPVRVQHTVVGDFIRAASMLSTTADELSQQIIAVHAQLLTLEDEQQQLRSEKNDAVKQIRSLLKKLAKTEADKDAAKTALRELERPFKFNDARLKFGSVAGSDSYYNPISSADGHLVLNSSIAGMNGSGSSYFINTAFSRCEDCGSSLSILSASKKCAACSLLG